MVLLQRMRIVGSGLVIAAYFITLHLDVVTGVIVHLTAMSISIPYFIKSKAYKLTHLRCLYDALSLWWVHKAI